MKSIFFLSVLIFLSGCAGKSEPSKEPTPLFFLEPEIIAEEKNPPPVLPNYENVMTMRDLSDLQKYLYTIDRNLKPEKLPLDLEKLLAQNIKTELRGKEPKLLICHTHSQERYKGSEGSIVDLGRLLAEVLANEHGISAVHDIAEYDVNEDGDPRARSYEYMEDGVRRILEKYPSIEVLVDLHRDGVDGDLRFVTEIDGETTAKIMYFNGISEKNPYILENLALSLNMQLTSNELYPGLTRKIYVKPNSYSQHILPKSLLIEVGANTNTFDEAKNAIAPLAEILVKALAK